MLRASPPTGAPITSLTVTRDGAKIVTGGGEKDHSIRLWNLADGAAGPLLSGHAAPVQFLSVSADNTRLASAASDNLVKVWDLVTGRELQSFPGHAGPALAVAYHNDNKSIISGSADKTVQI